MANQLDKKFEKLIAGIVKVEKAKADAAQRQTEPRPWMNFASDDIPSTQRPSSKTEKQLNDKTFNRADANQAYVKARADKDATANDAALPKLAGDYLAACVRDKRLQWRSRIRQLAHGFAVGAGNGEDAGPLRKNTVDYLQRIFLKAESKEKTIVA